MANQPNALYEALRTFKFELVEEVRALCEETGVNVDITVESVWVTWSQMTIKERADHPEVQPAGGMYRVGVKLSGGHRL